MEEKKLLEVSNSLFDICNEMEKLESSLLCLEESFRLQNWETEAYLGAMMLTHDKASSVCVDLIQLFELTSGEKWRSAFYNAK